MLKECVAEDLDMQDGWHRKGPEPLHVHMNIAMSRCAAGEISNDDLARFIAGIRKYQQHPFKSQMTTFDTVWCKNDAALYHCPVAQNSEKQASLLIVPSLINKAFIFDLLPGKSFVRWMAQNGVEVFLLDWGDLQHENAPSDFASIFWEYMAPSIAAANDIAQHHLYGLGYCMGGTLLASALSLNPGMMSGGIFLASPWDFHAGDLALTNRVKATKLSASQIMAQKNILPADIIQGVFAGLDPNQMIRKFSRFLDMDADSDEEKIFIAVEDWLNDGQGLPAAIANGLIYDWYDHNLLQKGAWRPNGRQYIRPENIDIPVLVVASRRDRLVPYQSSAVLAEKISRAELHEPDCGHIGIMAGRDAEKQVWEPVCDWIKKSLQ